MAASWNGAGMKGRFALLQYITLFMPIHQVDNSSLVVL